MEFDKLPIEIIAKILSELSVKDLYATKGVSRVFNAVTGDLIYRKMLELYFPHHYIPRSLDNTFSYQEQFERAIQSDCRSGPPHFSQQPFTPTQIAIFHAAKTGNLDLFMRNLNVVLKNPDDLKKLVELYDQAGRNFLVWAGYFGHQNILDAAFAELRKVLHTNKNDIDYITLALSCNKVEVIKNLPGEMLHQYNEQISIVDFLTIYGHLELIEYLVNDCHLAVTGRPFITACAYGNQRLLEYWVEKIPEVEDDLFECLYGAADGNNTIGLHHLLKLSSKVSLEDTDKSVNIGKVIAESKYDCGSPLALAIKRNRIKLSLLLLTKASSVNHLLSRDGLYNNPYQFTKVLNQRLADDIFNIVKQVYEDELGNLDLSKRDEYGNSIFHWIAYCGQKNVLHRLTIIAPTVFGEQNMAKQTPAQLAAICGNLDILKYFINCGLDVNTTGGDKQTILGTACQHRHVDLVEYLLSCPGIDVNKVNHSDMSPLMYAAEHGNVRMLKMLLSCPNIDVDLTAGNWNALFYAVYFNNDECVELLQKNRSCRCTIL